MHQIGIINELLLAGAAQGLLLAVVILSLRSANPVANRILALFVALEAQQLFLLYLVYSPPDEPPAAMIRLLFGMRALAAPALYLYVRAMTEHPFRLRPREALHLWVMLPPLVWIACMAVSPEWWSSSTLELQQRRSTILASSYQSVLMTVYGWLALGRLNLHMYWLEQALSSVERVSLRWLKWLMAALIAIHVLHLLLDALRLAGVLGPQSKILVNLFMTLLMIYLISIGGLRQPRVFTHSVRRALAAVDASAGNQDAAGSSTRNHPKAKYAKSGLDEERRARIWERLQTLLRTEKPYLDPTLDLPKLARKTGVRPQELSEVINTHYGGSFYDLVNFHRVEAAKQLLLDPARRQRKMLDLALSVGFSSQSTFYSQFKRHTGMTPTAFRDAASSASPAADPAASSC